jgi:hypothetical protein
MHRIDNASASNTLPAPSPAGTPGYFTDGNPGGGVPATVLPAEWLNMVQEEISNVIEDSDAGNTALSKASRTQLKESILAMIAANMPLTRGYIDGFILTNNASDLINDIDFGPGVARADNTTNTLNNASTMTKRLDAAWAVGNNQGGLFSGSKTSGTAYHCFCIRNDSTGTLDFGFDTSLTAANKPVGYTAYRRLGTIWTDGSNNIRQHIQVGDSFYYKTPVLDANGVTVNATATLQSLTVPPGLRVEAIIKARAYDTSNDEANVQLTSPDLDDLAPTYNTEAMMSFGWETNTIPGNATAFWTGRVLTNTSRQIRQRGDGLSATGGLWIATIGYVDPRGQNAA